MKKWFLNDIFILILIIVNAVVIFVLGFDLSNNTHLGLLLVDNLITILFTTEIIVKIREYGRKEYFKSNWNVFDFVLVVLSLPTLIAFVFHFNMTDLSFVLIFRGVRVFRVFKSFRFLKFIPHIDGVVSGIQRALKSSVFVIIGFAVYVFIISVLSYHLFGRSATEYFTDPFMSLYSIFKIFTVEGWYEIPDAIVAGGSHLPNFFIYGYFIFILLTGGIFGLSLVNSIFVDAMVSDNNDELEAKMDEMNKKMDSILKKLE